MKWKQHGESNSVPEKTVTPRISLIVAIDNYGEVYVSAT